MNKNILAFLIPLITLSVIAFTPILDGPLSNLKYKVNLVSKKTMEKLKDTNSTKIKLVSGFKNNIGFYEKEINKVFKNTDAQTHAMNYIFYLNQRNLVLSNNNIKTDKSKIIKDIFKYDMFMRKEYQAILDLGIKNNFNLIKLYKDRNETNKQISSYAYQILLENEGKFKESYFMGDDINYTASTKRVF